MTELDWTDLPMAPSQGTVICRDRDVHDGAALCVEISGFPLILLRSQSGIKAYVNCCPHLDLPLNFRSDAILTSDGRRLQCSNHDAIFDLETGAGVLGHGLGSALLAVPVTVTSDNRVIVGHD